MLRRAPSDCWRDHETWSLLNWASRRNRWQYPHQHCGVRIVCSWKAGPESDVDVVMVHPSGVQSTPAWSEGVEEWRHAARRLTGNEVEVVEVDERDIGIRLRSRRPVWLDIRQDGIVIFGKTLDIMRAARRRSPRCLNHLGRDRSHSLRPSSTSERPKSSWPRRGTTSPKVGGSPRPARPFTLASTQETSLRGPIWSTLCR